MNRDEIAVAFYAGLLAKNGLVGTRQNQEYQKELILRAFELADVFDCCKEKTLDEIKLLVHTMLPEPPPPETASGPHSVGGHGGGAGGPAAPWTQFDPQWNGASGPQGASGQAGGHPVLKSVFYKTAGWAPPVIRGEDDCSGGVTIP